ncbi:phosphatase PAP2 family protein [Lysobacter sp. 2RAF19]
MTPARLYGPQLIAMAVAAVALAWVFHATALDLRLANPWYDPVSHSFPLRSSWITTYAIHRQLKLLSILLGLVMWWMALRALRARTGFLATHRRRLWCIAICFLAVPAVMAILQTMSTMHCPWDVIEYGGAAPYRDLLQAPAVGVRAGHCFPARFVTVGSWMLSFACLWYPEKPRRCIVVGVIALAWALALGWIQQARGAHFLSHTLWSLWISWGIVLLVHALCGAWRESTDA